MGTQLHTRSLIVSAVASLDAASLQIKTNHLPKVSLSPRSVRALSSSRYCFSLQNILSLCERRRGEGQISSSQPAIGVDA